MLQAHASLDQFQKILVDEFIRELQFYLDVSAGRSSGRADFTDKLIEQAKNPLLDLISKVPIPGTGILQSGVSYAIDWLNDQRKEGGLVHAQLLGYGNETEKLRILLENVAMEAASRYQFWITACLEPDSLKGVTAYAQAGVERMLEYVLRKKCSLTFDNLLHGLIEGRSGAYVSGYRNTTLSVVGEQTDTSFLAKTKRFFTIGEYTAEGAYGRAALQTYNHELWALNDKKKSASRLLFEQAIASGLDPKAMDLDDWFDYGYAKLQNKTDPKYGYMLVPRMVKHLLIGHLDEKITHQSKAQLSDLLQEKLFQYKPIWITITFVELQAYIDSGSIQKGISLLAFCKTLHSGYSAAERVIYRADASSDEWNISQFDFEGADLSYCVFNHCHFGGSLNHTKWHQSYLREADFTHVISAKHADFSEAHMECIHAPKVNFQNSILRQAHLQYAILIEANLDGTDTLGALWNHADLTRIQSTDTQGILNLQQKQVELARQYAVSFAKINDTQTDQQEQIDLLRHDLVELEAKLRDKTLKQDDSGPEEQTNAALQKLDQLTAGLLQEQQARIALTRHCQRELIRLSQHAENSDKVTREHTEQIALIEKNIAKMNEDHDHLMRCIQETHGLAEKVSQANFKIEDLEHALSSLEERLQNQLIELSQKVEAVEKRIKKETLPELLLELNTHAKHLSTALDLPQLLPFYIPLNAQRGKLREGKTEDLSEAVDQFLLSESKKKERVLLLLGDPGTGKSLFGLLLQQRLWRAREDLSQHSMKDATLVPIRIEMKRFNQDTAKSCVHYVFQNDYNFSEDAIRTLKTSNNQFVFIFDGYDELAGGGLVNLYRANQLDTWGVNPKVIIGCRFDYLREQSYLELLGPGGYDNNAQISEYHLLPLTPQQINDYLKKSASKSELGGRSTNEYEQFLKETPGLTELVSTPFLLKIYISAYPSLRARTTSIARADLYEDFMHAWFKKEEQKLIDSEGPMKGDIKKGFLNFSRQLAFMMYTARINEVTYRDESDNPWEFGNEKGKKSLSEASQDAIKWEPFFSNASDKTVRIRRGAPLRCIDGRTYGRTYGFIHQSFLEYFVADMLWDALWTDHDVLQRWGERCLMKEPKMPAVIHFLADRVRSHPESQEKLYRFIAASKRPLTQSLTYSQKELVILAASNAITVLNYSLVAFSLKAIQEPQFFTEIQVPYADLSTAELSHVDLSRSDLSYTTLIGAKLSHAVLDQCILKGIDVKQFPMLREENAINSVAVAPSENFIAVAHGNLIQLYQRAGAYWERAAACTRHKKDVLSVVFSPDENQLASSGLENSIRLWSLDGTMVGKFKGHTDPVTSLTYSPNGTWIASGSKDTTVRLWNRDLGVQQHVFRGHKGKVTSVVFSPDGQILASGCKDKTIRLWDVANQQYLRTIDGGCYVTCIRFSPDGVWLASGGLDHLIRLWRMSSHDHIRPILAKGHTQVVTNIIFFPDGQQMASSSKDKTIRLWHMNGTLNGIFDGHTDPITTIALLASENQLISGSLDKTLRLWGVDKSLFSSAYGQSTQEIISIASLEGHSDAVSSIAFSMDGRHFASGSFDTSIRLWKKDNSLSLLIRSGARKITSLAFPFHGHYFASAHNDSCIQLWSMNGTPGPVIESGGAVSSLTFSPHQNQLAASQSNIIELWDLDHLEAPPKIINLRANRTPTRLPSIRFEASETDRSSKLVGENSIGLINCLAYSPIRLHDPQTSEHENAPDDVIAFGNSDMTVKVWWSETQRAQVLRGHTHEVSTVAFFHDGLRLVSGSLDNTLRLWNLLTGISQCLTGHIAEVTSVSISFNGGWIASASHDKTIRLWKVDAHGAQEHTLLKGHKEAVMSAIFSPNSYDIVSGGWDNTVRLWRCADFDKGVWVPVWQHPRDNTLLMEACSVRDPIELSPSNQKLFEQLAGIKLSVKPPESERKDWSLLSPKRVRHLLGDGSDSSGEVKGPVSPKKPQLSENPYGLFTQQTARLTRISSHDIELDDILAAPADTPDISSNAIHLALNDEVIDEPSTQSTGSHETKKRQKKAGHSGCCILM